MRARRNEIDIWELILRPTEPMSRETAKAILSLDFRPDEVERMHELAARNREGKLSSDQDEELDNYCRIGNTLSLLQARARQVLKSRQRAS